ncbi:MAG TPA: thermonuclease family protein [Hyphomicrobiaceae bacterium]|jgi:endonuclease YncB( thermonuclease family)|nr:thermonuclease family protein [Hyphomicrobiaceae bacterium]
MFASRKKQDGFEWHKYIRTTIKLRRDARRQKVEDARRAAAQQMNAAGSALAQGSRAAGAAAAQGARAGVGAAGLLAQQTGSMLSALATILAQKIAVASRPLIAILAQPNIGGPLALAAGIALGAAIGRGRGIGMDGEALATLAIGIGLLIAVLPMISQATGIGMPRIPGVTGGRVLLTVAAAVLAGGLAWMTRGGLHSPISLANMPLIGGGTPLRGRAEAVGGDLLRVGGRVVRLAGIEAPEPEQRCGRSGARQWRCSAAAEAALARLVHGRTVSCSPSGTDNAGRPLAYCSSGHTDVNAEMVRKGYVFAADGLFARYASAEQEARSAKAGVWSGDVQRPADFRARLWDEAKRHAPDGCPIKGQVAGGARVYVLPWSPEYGRARVQKARGERWFCSEEDAVAAGFRPADERG